MADHTKALVPVDTWCYNCPAIRYGGRVVDVGLMAEALIYYDRVLLSLNAQAQFAELLSWFVRQRKFGDLLALFNDKTVQIYEYSFVPTALEKGGSGEYRIVVIQDEIQERPNTFEQRYLGHPSVTEFLNQRDQAKLCSSLSGKVVEAKAAGFRDAMRNAEADFGDVKKRLLLLQALVDDVYPSLKQTQAPVILAKRITRGGKPRIAWSISMKDLAALMGNELYFHAGTPLVGAIACNTLCQAAAGLKCDLYLGTPMSVLVGNKLYESGYRVRKAKDALQRFTGEVDFPDVRSLVNAGKLNLRNIMKIRDKTRKLREWVQSQKERDPNAFFASHSEVAGEVGLRQAEKRAVSLFGALGGGAAAAPAGGAAPVAPKPGPDTGSTGGAGFLFDLGLKLGQEWKPIVFGKWSKDRIERIVGKG